ncbi:MAG: rubrerythrin [Verrucomicrobia bacterium]|nr:rubrerythrin [Verrucomicrobiota bacterium]
MIKEFNADEIFQMAERVELDAADFYTKAAEIHGKNSDAGFLRRMAEMETRHRDVFSAMRKALPPACREPAADSPHPKATLYLDECADAHGGEGTLSASQPLTASDSLESIIQKAMGFERETLKFYLEMRDRVAADRGRDKIELIIKEEQSHMGTLADELAKLRGKGSDRGASRNSESQRVFPNWTRGVIT